MFVICCMEGMFCGYFRRLQNSFTEKCSESVMSLMFFMVLFFDDSDILVEAEDGACEEERLCDIVEQSCGNVVNLDHLISHQCNAAHDEQHRTGVLRVFKVRVFHGNCLHHGSPTASPQNGGNNVTKDLEYFSKCCVHGNVCLSVNN